MLQPLFRLPPGHTPLAGKGSTHQGSAGVIYPIAVGSMKAQRVAVADSPFAMIGPGLATVSAVHHRAKLDPCEDHIGICR